MRYVLYVLRWLFAAVADLVAPPTSGRHHRIHSAAPPVRTPAPRAPRPLPPVHRHWRCPLCHTSFTRISPRHDCPADRPPSRPALPTVEAAPRTRIVPDYYAAWEASQRQHQERSLDRELAVLLRQAVAMGAGGTR